MWHTHIIAKEENDLNSADRLSREKNQKLQNQTVCALAVALLCALILALLVLDVRFETPFATGSNEDAEPLTGSPWQSTQPESRHAFQTWLFVCAGFVSGILILIASAVRSDKKRRNNASTH